MPSRTRLSGETMLVVARNAIVPVCAWNAPGVPSAPPTFTRPLKVVVPVLPKKVDGVPTMPTSVPGTLAVPLKVVVPVPVLDVNVPPVIENASLPVIEPPLVADENEPDETVSAARLVVPAPRAIAPPLTVVAPETVRCAVFALNVPPVTDTDVGDTVWPPSFVVPALTVSEPPIARAAAGPAEKSAFAAKLALPVTESETVFGLNALAVVRVSVATVRCALPRLSVAFASLTSSVPAIEKVWP